MNATVSDLPEATRAKHAEMMKRGRPLPVLVYGQGERGSPGVMRLQEWDKKERTRRALKFWLYCWALSLLSIIIPLAHFVLVPGFFIAGPIGAWVVSTQASQLLGGESACPDCQAFLPLAPAADGKWPLTDLCTACHHRMRIERA
jgi:hypothetical protein